MGFGDVVIIGLGLCLVVGGLTPVITRLLLRSRGRRTRGSVVGFNSYSDSSGSPAQACIVEYVVAGERFRITGRWNAGSSAVLGSECTVYYWPRRPQRGHLVDAASWFGPLVLSLSGAVLAATAFDLPVV